MRTNGTRFLLLFILLLGASGCTPLPRQELAAYSRTFDQTRSMGEDLLVQLQIDSADPLSPEKDSLEEDFDYRAESGQGGTQKDIAVRFRAWQVMSAYRDALVTLAGGASGEDLGGTASSLASSLIKLGSTTASLAGAAIPFASLVTDVIGQAIHAIEQLVIQRKFKEAVRLATPVIRDVISVLLEDTRIMYSYRFQRVQSTEKTIYIEIGRMIQDLEDIVAATNPPDQSEVDSVKANLAEISDMWVSLRPLGGDTKNAVPKFAFVRGKTKPDWSNKADREVSSSCDRIRSLCASAKVLRKGLSSYRAALVLYIHSLSALDECHRALELYAAGEMLDVRAVGEFVDTVGTLVLGWKAAIPHR